MIGDLNGDGRNDVAIFTESTFFGSEIMVYYQGTQGEFDNVLSMNALTDEDLYIVWDIQVGDFNNDGRIDLGVLGAKRNVTSGYVGRLVIFYQDAVTGDLGTGQHFMISSNYTYRFGVGDLNSDGRQDVVVSRNGPPPPPGGIPENGLSVFYQNSNGALEPEVVINRDLYSRAEIYVADMDNDGDTDIVIQSGNKQIAVIKQTAAKIFSTSPDYYDVQTSYSNFIWTFSVGDVNDDGRNDVVTLDPGNSGLLNILLQNGSGYLHPPIFVTVNSSPLYGIEISDIDRDGRNDIIGNVVDAGFPNGIGQVHVFYQNASNTFSNPVIYSFPTVSGGGSGYTETLAIGDVTGDGRPDAVLTWSNEGLFVLPNQP